MTWFVFGAGLIVGVILGVLGKEWIPAAVEWRRKKKIPFDRGLL